MVDLMQLKPTSNSQWKSSYEEHLALFSKNSGAKRVAVFEPNRIRFTGILLAALHSQRNVVLAGDVLSNTVNQLRPLVDLWVPATLSTNEAVAQRQSSTLVGITIFTSGTTGTPQSIFKSLDQLNAEIETLESTFHSLVDRAQFYSTVSHQHIYGLLFSVLWPASFGRLLSADNLTFPEQFDAAFSTGESVLVSSPALLKRLSHIDAVTASPKAVFSSGGALDGASAGSVKRLLGVNPIEVFGSSETGGIAYRKTPDAPWTPFEKVETRLGVDGALEIKSPHLPNEDWHRCNDRVEFRGSAFLLKGRSDRIVKIEEKRVSLAGIETASLATGLIGRSQCVMIERGGRNALALVMQLSATGLSRTRKEIIEVLKAALINVVEPVAMPKWFRFVSDWPQNELGKTTQAALLPLFADDFPPVTWVERSKRRAELHMRVDLNLRVLHGHFTDIPVVPGVAQVAWAQHFAREAFSLPERLLKLEVLKFQKLLRPPTQATLLLEINPSGSVSFKISNEKGVASSGRLVFS
jgi:acyl-coenzyme A synthetase/AMP-(fatty) acid ligase/3-hydroxymyristoyl/3-hydroxydecanoyl-(acyl carrier protein) dehydratase